MKPQTRKIIAREVRILLLCYVLGLIAGYLVTCNKNAPWYSSFVGAFSVCIIYYIAILIVRLLFKCIIWAVRTLKQRI